MSRVATSKICGNTVMRSLIEVHGRRLEILTARAHSQRLTTAAFSTTSLRASGQQNIFPKKGGAPPRAGVPYSPATKAGGFIFISGQTSVLENGDYLPVDSSVSEKTHRMCQNARAILEGAGSSTDKVVNVKVYFTNIDRDYDEFNTVYAEYFPHNPSKTSVEVTGLPKPADLEIDVIALA